MRVDWSDIFAARADALDGRPVEIDGWMLPPEGEDAPDVFPLLPEPPCCLGCPPRDPVGTVEIIAAAPIPHHDGEIRLSGLWRRLPDGDPSGLRYQLAQAVAMPPPAAAGFAFSRRAMLAAGTLIGLVACRTGGAAENNAQARATGRQALAGHVTVDMHSHGGRLLPGRTASPRPFEPLAEPMRQGGMAVACLAIVADSPATRIIDKRVKPARTPEPGELYAWSRDAFVRLHRLAGEQGLGIVTDGAGLSAAGRNGPAVIVAAEGADFLEGRLERLDEAHTHHHLRHLQLTHYRVNEVGDIQTEPPVHGGLTDFGAEVIRRCNRLGIVVDIAHGPAPLVRRAAAVTDKPLVLSHTSLSANPSPRSRTIGADHARMVAETGGVIGIWPPATLFPDLPAFAGGIARMADVVGADHVGLGSDMMGLLSPSAFADYRHLPDLAGALVAVGFRPAEVAAILGGNYARVFTTVMGKAAAEPR